MNKYILVYFIFNFLPNVIYSQTAFDLNGMIPTTFSLTPSNSHLLIASENKILTYGISNPLDQLKIYEFEKGSMIKMMSVAKDSSFILLGLKNGDFFMLNTATLEDSLLVNFSTGISLIENFDHILVAGSKSGECIIMNDKFEFLFEFKSKSLITSAEYVPEYNILFVSDISGNITSLNVAREIKILNNYKVSTCYELTYLRGKNKLVAATSGGLISFRLDKDNFLTDKERLTNVFTTHVTNIENTHLVYATEGGDLIIQMPNHYLVESQNFSYKNVENINGKLNIEFIVFSQTNEILKILASQMTFKK